MTGKLSFRIVKIFFRNWLDFDGIIETSKRVALKYAMKEVKTKKYFNNTTLQLLHQFTTIINSAPFAEQGISRPS